MSNGMQRQISQRKQVRSALERIDGLEEEFPRFAMAVNKALSEAGQRQERLAGILQAVVELLGSETVDAKIKELDESKVLSRLAEAKLALEKGLQEGAVVPTEGAGDKSLVVGREFDAKGEVLFPGRVQLQFASLRPDYQEKLRGHGVGFTMDTEGGGKFEVVEVYDVVEAPPAPVPAAPTGLAETTSGTANVEVETTNVPGLVETPEELEAALTPSEG